MKNHIKNELYENCKKFKELSKEFIEKSKQFFKVCELVNVAAKCMEDTNNIILISDDLIDNCQKIMDYIKLHKENCDNEECKHLCDDILFASKEDIKAISEVEIECEHDLTACVDSVKLAVQKTKDLEKIIDKFLQSV